MKLKMKELLIMIAKGLVEDPDAVEVVEDEPDEDGVIVFHLHVAPDDMGRVDVYKRQEFAFLIGTTPQNLSDILRGNRFAEDTLKKWERKCRQALNDMDGIAAVGLSLIHI